MNDPLVKNTTIIRLLISIKNPVYADAGNLRMHCNSINDGRTIARN